MPALLYTLGVFALILVLARFKAPLSAAIAVGAVVIGALFGMGADNIAKSALAGAVHPGTIALAVIIAVLIGLSEIMRASGQLERIVLLAKAFLRRPAVAMAALPALIGLLPMPGGALFSAPMVGSAADGTKVSGARLSAINYYFRHIWECWWPLYPGMILAVSVTKLDFLSFIRFQFPLSVIMVACGLLILRKMHSDLHVAAPPPPKGTRRKLLKATSSIWLLVVIWGVVKLLLWAFLYCPPRPQPGEPALAGTDAVLATVHGYMPIGIGMLVSLFWTIRLNRLGAAAVRKAFSDKRVYTMALLVISVMVFKHMLTSADATGRISVELADMNVPVIAVIAILPFIAGMVTGIAAGFVGTSFPIVMGLIPKAGPIPAYVALAFFFGHAGQMLSPMHLCLILSNRHFKTDFGQVYRIIIPPIALAGVLAVGYFLILRAIL
ncbi:MAG: DUF401 family protein [Phycisphaerae bacterium]|nr:DUF401 family protein [Phycisphaerae bacterium]